MSSVQWSADAAYIAVGMSNGEIRVSFHCSDKLTVILIFMEKSWSSREQCL